MSDSSESSISIHEDEPKNMGIKEKFMKSFKKSVVF